MQDLEHAIRERAYHLWIADGPLDVLIDLLGGADFDHEILDPEAAAKIIIERLLDAGFRIVARPRGASDEAPAPIGTGRKTGSGLPHMREG